MLNQLSKTIEMVNIQWLTYRSKHTYFKLPPKPKIKEGTCIMHV